MWRMYKFYDLETIPNRWMCAFYYIRYELSSYSRYNDKIWSLITTELKTTATSKSFSDKLLMFFLYSPLTSSSVL